MRVCGFYNFLFILLVRGRGLCDVLRFALTHSHPLSVLRDYDDYHERRRGDYFKRREVDFLL